VDQSPKKYINDKKLERSCQMLLENRYGLGQQAEHQAVHIGDAGGALPDEGF